MSRIASVILLVVALLGFGLWRELRQAKGRVAALETHLSDYAGLTKYKDDTTPARVVCIGDSITENWKDAPCLNRGIREQTTAQMLLRFQQDVLRHHPEVVIIHGGTNDIYFGRDVSEAVSNIQSMCELARANGVRCFIASALPSDDPRRPPGSIAELNARLRALGFEYVDYHSAVMPEWPRLSDDGTHPNREGYGMMRTIVERALGR